jgi:hypothetical protein
MLLHYQFRTLVALLPALILYDLAAFAECIRRGFLPQWFMAIWSLAPLLPEVRTRRKRWQLQRKALDREILVGGPLPFATGLIEGPAARRLVQFLGAVMQFNWDLVQ